PRAWPPPGPDGGRGPPGSPDRQASARTPAPCPRGPRGCRPCRPGGRTAPRRRRRCPAGGRSTDRRPRARRRPGGSAGRGGAAAAGVDEEERGVVRRAGEHRVGVDLALLPVLSGVVDLEAAEAGRHVRWIALDGRVVGGERGVGVPERLLGHPPRGVAGAPL